jgi:hypothetical protein
MVEGATFTGGCHVARAPQAIIPADARRARRA